MKNILARESDILSIIDKLDISPTMYKNAKEKYDAITNALSDCNIESDMYPQGSFALGTVVRPAAISVSASYDLDFICQVRETRDTLSPSELRNKIEHALESNTTYGGKLHIYPECITVEYADIGNHGFSIDIVPAVDESAENKCRLSSMSTIPALISTAIAIPKHNAGQNYSWITNNPKGFRTWFEAINAPYLEVSKEAFKNKLYKENRALFASVEDIPAQLIRSPLQRVIQLFKYHRDVYYSKIREGETIKPISALITTVIAKIAQHHSPECTVFELLEFIVDELDIYALHQLISSDQFSKNYGNRTVFLHNNGVWYIANPANPEDNLADKWNNDKRIPDYFFRWIKVLRNDVIDGLQLENDQDFRNNLENGFGKLAVSSVLGDKYINQPVAKTFTLESTGRPYRLL